LLLLDEPFSGLDAPVREELRRELRRLQRERGLSTVLVTHDPEEAALLADEIVVIDAGHVLQAGPVQAVYRRPACPQVARLVGVQNVNEGVAVSPVELKVGAAVIRTAHHGVPDGAPVLWCIRPELVNLSARGQYPANVLDSADLGGVTAALIRLAGGPELRLRTTVTMDPAPGSFCRVDLDPDAITVWESPTPATPQSESLVTR
jgi:molybdate transport system permease protein